MTKILFLIGRSAFATCLFNGKYRKYCILLKISFSVKFRVKNYITKINRGMFVKTFRSLIV